MQGMGCLAVLVLDSLPELAVLWRFQGCPALRAVSVSSCPALGQVDLGGLTRLEQLRIRGCGLLQAVAGVKELPALTRLVVAGCGRLPEVDLEGASALLTVPNLGSPVRLEQRASTRSAEQDAAGGGTCSLQPATELVRLGLWRSIVVARVHMGRLIRSCCLLCLCCWMGSSYGVVVCTRQRCCKNAMHGGVQMQLN
jgi:hypothetical protein